MSLKHAILGFLSFAPLTGYDLKKAFDSSVAHFWSADQSQIYRTLTQIVEQGLAEVETVPQTDRPNRKVYQLTAAGRVEFERWLVTPLPAQEEHDALLLQVFFASLLPPPQASALFVREAARTREILAQLQEVAAQYPTATSRAQAFALLTLDYGIKANLYQLDWLESVLSRLDDPSDVLNMES